jgi:flagellar biosynthesis protein FlhF
MNAKTYRARTIQEALDQIKRELGPEAVILSTQPIMTRNALGLRRKQNWEITAAAVKPEPRPEPEPVDSAFRVKDNVNIKSSVRERNRAAILGSSRDISRHAPVSPPHGPAIARRLRHNDSRMEELLDEITELKRSVRLIGKAMPGSTAEAGGIFAELVGQGVDHDLADQLVTKESRGNPSPTELRERVRRGLAERLVIDPAAELIGRTQVVSAFVGPTGAGKTTTIAKLAGHAKVRHKKRVALISTDMFRVGGHEQLARYGELLGVETYACADHSALKNLIATLDDRDLIMIDTPGSGPADFGRLHTLEAVTVAANVRVHLVLAAGTRSEDITNIVKRFQRFSPRRAVLTKMDETEPRGAIVSDVLRNAMPISFLTNGQRVPEDLVIPSADELARYLLPTQTVPAAKIPGTVKV